MSLAQTWYQIYARALFGSRFGPTLRTAFVYDLVYKVLGIILLAPAFAWALDRLISTSGGLIVTNEAIAGFLLSVPGLLFLLFALSFGLLSMYAEQAGIAHIAYATGRGTPASWMDALRTVLAALPRLLRLALVQAAILLAVLLPLAAIAAGLYLGLLGEHDINWYLANRPPEFWTAVGFGAVLAVIAAAAVLYFAVTWLLCIPVTLYEPHRGRAALRRSAQLLRGHRLRALGLFLINLALALMVTALAFWLLNQLFDLLLGLVDGVRAQVVISGLALAIFAATAALSSFLVMTVYAVLALHLYLDLRDDTAQSNAGWAQASRRARVPAWALIFILATLATGAFAMVQNSIDDLAIGRDVQVTAHRGSSKYAPENTLAALRRAIEDGADYAEIDVQETADGGIVLLHDTDLMRIADNPLKIWEAQLSDLADIDAGSWFSPEFAAERVPTLEQALDLAKGNIGLNIELKYNGHDVALAQRTLERLRAAGCGDDCFITSLNQAGLARVRKLAPEVKIGQILTASIGDVTKLDVDFLSMNAELVSPAQVRANRDAGLATHVWTVNQRDDMERMMEAGVDNIISDEPATLSRLIAEREQLTDGELLLMALGRRLRQ